MTRTKQLIDATSPPPKFLTTLLQVVDHSNKEEEQQFQELVVSVFDNSAQRDTYTIRTELFDVLMAYFPESMSQPKDNLTDYVPPV